MKFIIIIIYNETYNKNYIKLYIIIYIHIIYNGIKYIIINIL